MSPRARTVAVERIERATVFLRGEKVLLDRDLARLYGVSTSNLNKAVSRNLARFPEDFMFTLTAEERGNLMFQNGTSSWGGSRKPPRAFTEQGVAMLSSVLRSEKAVRVNIEIMRTFVRVRRTIASHTELAHKLEELEHKYDRQFATVFGAIRQLMAPPAEAETTRSQIGFRAGESEVTYQTRPPRRAAARTGQRPK